MLPGTARSMTGRTVASSATGPVAAITRATRSGIASSSWYSRSIPRGVFGAAGPAKARPSRGWWCNLRQNVLFRRHTDLRAGAGEHRAPADQLVLQDRQHWLSAPWRVGPLQRVGGFPTRDRHYQGATVQHWILIAELVGEFHFHGRRVSSASSRTWPSGVICGTAGHHEHVVTSGAVLVAPTAARRKHDPPPTKCPEQRCRPYRGGLLGDLLSMKYS